MSSACWACNALTSQSVFCDVCRKLQPVLDNSSFARLDIPLFFDVDLKLLEEQYFKAQRLVHPDRFISASKPEKIYSAQHSAAINDAYTTLKDPIKRSQELLKINGHAMANIEQQTLDDPELLMEVIELREELLEVSSKEQLDHLKARIETLLVQNTDAISKAFQSHDYNDAAKLLNRLRYLNKICLEANQRRVA